MCGRCEVCDCEAAGGLEELEELPGNDVVFNTIWLCQRHGILIINALRAARGAWSLSQLVAAARAAFKDGKIAA